MQKLKASSDSSYHMAQLEEDWNVSMVLVFGAFVPHNPWSLDIVSASVVTTLLGIFWGWRSYWDAVVFIFKIG